MKEYIKNAIKELQESDKLKIEVKLKDNNDYKKNIFRLLYNKFILAIQQKMVPMYLKNFILRTTGMNIGHDVCIPHDITIDPYFPELYEDRFFRPKEVFGYLPGYKLKPARYHDKGAGKKRNGLWHSSATV